jgi:hypothetical protein
LPCGWSKDGLQTFNNLAKKISADRQKHGEEFDKAFKKTIEQEMASTNRTGKRKRNYIETYNDLNKGELFMNASEKAHIWGGPFQCDNDLFKCDPFYLFSYCFQKNM